MDYFSRLGDRLYELCLTIEGACEVFDKDALPVFKLALQNEKYEAAIAFDTVTTGLFNLRETIRDMQMELMKDEVKGRNSTSSDET